MKNLFIGLFIILSLVVTPVAHAAGMDCADHDGSISAKTLEKVESSKPDAAKLAKAMHHCCCNPVFSQILLNAPLSLAIATSSTLITSKDSALTSVIVGPPLEPPSHA